MSPEDYTKAFNKTLRDYRKYQLKWLAEHNFTLYNLAEHYESYKEHLEDGTYHSDRFEDYLIDYCMDDLDEKMLPYKDWLTAEKMDLMHELANNSTKEDVMNAVETFHDMGLIGDEDYNKYKDILDSQKGHKKHEN